ncbi:MAG TPA: glycoside hydrolase family 15, partial [Firmicutes bacterium]|nr:glycoside hydrolase family 15 [Bacillota bacterium]
PIEPGNAWQITIFTCCSRNRSGVLASLAAARGQGAGNLKKTTELAWSDWLEQMGTRRQGIASRSDTCQSYFEMAEDFVDRTGLTQPINLTDGIYEELWKRSLVTLRLLTDETGAMIAAPEFDPDRRWCGGYGYCWGRDAAYMVYALDVAGCHEMTTAFYRWAARVQEPEGVWYQRYWVTGEVAPSWGFVQIDETGSILWGLWQHILLTQNQDLLQELWPTVERAADFLARYRDAETGLVDVSWDLWEERYGLHTYSCAAVWGGLQGAAQLALMLGKNEQAQLWSAAAASLKEAVLKYCWSPLHNRFLRCINQRVPEWLKHDPEHGHRVRELPPPAGYFYPEYIVEEDATVDVSLLGLVTPFGMLPADDARMQATVAVIERDLTQSPAGGVVRYSGDHYRGGNPWIICTLWLAQYYIQLGDRKRAVQLLDWAVDHRTRLDLLPEQIDRDTGEPAWVVPLAWSHAMYILTLAGLGSAK